MPIKPLMSYLKDINGFCYWCFMISEKLETEYGDSVVDELIKLKTVFPLKRLSQRERDDIHLWQYHTYDSIRKQGDKIPDMWKTNLTILPARLVRGEYTLPLFRMPEWIGFKAMRFVCARYMNVKDDVWFEDAGAAVTERLHLPLEKDAPEYGSQIRLDDRCKYFDEVIPKIGSLLDAEVIKDLADNSPEMGSIRHTNSHSWPTVAKATWQAIQECSEEISRNAQVPGAGFAILPPRLAAIVAMETPITGGEINFDHKESTIFWGRGANNVGIYSHPSVEHKIVVGYRPHDREKCGYIFQPYSFNMIGGPDNREHVYFDKMQLLLRRMKKLVNGGNGMYGTILYSPPRYGVIHVPLVNQTYPEL